MILSGLALAAYSQSVATVTCTSQGNCGSTMCCATVNSCSYYTSGDAYTFSTGLCVPSSSGLDNGSITYTDTTLGVINCMSAQCYSAQYASCTPVPYDSDSGTASACAVFGDSYCCMVPTINGSSDEYSNTVPGSCQTVDQVSTNQDNDQTVTCGAVGQLWATIGSLAVLACVF